MTQTLSNIRTNLHRFLGAHPLVPVAPITLLAFALRMFGLGVRTFWGDEYGSQLEAQHLTRNLNGIMYFLPLHYWIQLGTGEFWLRFLSVFTGILVVPVAFQLGRRVWSNWSGWAFALLMALSPFAIMYSQTIRFYSLFLFTSTLSLLAYWMLSQSPKSTARRFFFVIATLLVVASHLFGVLVVGAEGVARFLSLAPKARRAKRLRLIVLVLGAVLLLLLLFPALRVAGWNLLMRMTGTVAMPAYVESRGLSLVNLVKIPFAFYVFALGEGVYPLNLAIVVPTILVLGALVAEAMTVVPKHFSIFALITSVLLMLLSTFLLFDPLASGVVDTASSRYVIFALPAFLLLPAIGLAQIRFRLIFLAIIVLLSFVALGQYYFGDWNYEIPINTNWRALADFATQASNDAVVVYDGRSADPVTRYFDPRLTKKSYWQYFQTNSLGDLTDAPAIVFVTNDYQPERRKGFDRILALLEGDFEMVAGQVRYPIFEYAFQRKTVPQQIGYSVDPQTQLITLPKEIYGLEFQDLALPAKASFAGSEFPITGSFALPNLTGLNERHIALIDAKQSSALVLLSNVTGAGRLRKGETIGELQIQGLDGSKQLFPLRLGDQTQDWSNDCVAGNPCSSVLSWHKLVAMVGQRAYEGAWSDFEARIFGVRLNLSSPAPIKAITIRYLASSGQLNVWGMALR